MVTKRISANEDLEPQIHHPKGGEKVLASFVAFGVVPEDAVRVVGRLRKKDAQAVKRAGHTLPFPNPYLWAIYFKDVPPDTYNLEVYAYDAENNSVLGSSALTSTEVQVVETPADILRLQIFVTWPNATTPQPLSKSNFVPYGTFTAPSGN